MNYYVSLLLFPSISIARNGRLVNGKCNNTHASDGRQIYSLLPLWNNNYKKRRELVSPRRFSVVFLLHFAEAEVFKEQYPNAVDPADDDTENDDDDSADDVFGVGFGQSCADAHHDLRDPVDDRDE